MTLTEAIERYTSNAEYERIHGNLQGCLDFRQLAEWLKDYERLLEQEPCEDAISRQAVQDYIAKYLSQYLYNDVREAVEVIDEYIGELPSVTSQPKAGHWIWCVGSHKCSNCEEYTCFSHRELLRYCPNCGARMEDKGC